MYTVLYVNYISIKLEEKNVVYPCYGGLLSNEKEGTIDVHTWLNLKIIMLNERSWRPKENSCMIPVTESRSAIA